VNSTISIDLSKSWTNSDVVQQVIKRPWASKSNQVLWTDHEKGVFYVWAGKWPNGKNMVENELWKFTPDGKGGGSWATDAPENPDVFGSLHQGEYMVYANNKNTGYAIGGIASGWTEKYRAATGTLPGMVTFDMNTKTWTNDSDTATLSPYEMIAAGGAHFASNLGPNGLILALGGVAHPVVGAVDWPGADPIDWKNLVFFDPETKKKYTQTATGDIPSSPRTQFCTTGFENPDGGYEMSVPAHPIPSLFPCFDC
jgi:hypothetical protein